MNTVKLEIEIELPTLEAAKLTKMCHDLTSGCPVNWFPLAKCPIMSNNCCDVKMKDWRYFLRTVETEE